MSIEQQALLKRSAVTIRASELLVRDDMAALAGYYAMFYLAEAFLIGEGVSFGSHKAVISEFGRRFSATARVPREFHRRLIKAQELRHDGDYAAEPNVTRDEEEEILVWAREMLAWTEANLA